MRVMHSAWNTLFYYDPEPRIEMLRRMMAIGDQELPLVWTHRSGRKSLILGATARHIIDMDFKRALNCLCSFVIGRPSHSLSTAINGPLATW